jgi:hypothetical protein
MVVGCPGLALDRALSRYTNIAGWRALAVSICSNEPVTNGRIASRS